jgi:hypothetical protein
MDKKVKQELSEMKYLFGYERGRVISEQNTISVEEDMDTVGVIDDIDFNDDEIMTMSGREVETPVRPDVDTPTKPKRPGTPYSPKPGPKKNPKAEDEVDDVDMPNWLSFDELGLNFDEE